MRASEKTIIFKVINEMHTEIRSLEEAEKDDYTEIGMTECDVDIDHISREDADAKNKVNKARVKCFIGSNRFLQEQLHKLEELI